MSEPVFDPDAWEAEPDIFDEAHERSLTRALDEAEADIAAGRLVSHERVSAWLMSLGTNTPLPRPE